VPDIAGPAQDTATSKENGGLDADTDAGTDGCDRPPTGGRAVRCGRFCASR
jgi:hypothetical protein